MKHKYKKEIFRIVITIAFGIIALIALYPIIWMFASSLKTMSDLYTIKWGFPSHPQWQNYVDAINTGLILHFKNSAIVVISAVMLMVLLGSMIAYSLTRYSFRGRKILFFYFLVGQMIPAQTVVVPLYLELKKMGLINTFAGLILAYAAAGLPFTVFLLQGFFRSVPRDLFDSAAIDGCSDYGIFWKIVLPLSKPAVASVIIFQSIYVWNEFIFALTILREEPKHTLTLAVYKIIGRYWTNYPLFFATLCIAIIPIIIVFFMFQRYFIKGITAGALKG